MNQITTVGVDLAKEVIVVCAGDAQGRSVYFKQFSFAGFAEWSVKLAPCAFGMEAQHIDQCIADCDAEIHNHVRHSEEAQRIQALSGIGPLTASALIATVSNPRDFKNGRQMAAWTGLVPRQNSSGGKQRLGVITKRGDSYLRGLLTQGARSTLQVALKRESLKRSRLEQWIFDLHARVGYHKTLVAIANKHVRIIWAILANGESYDPNAWQRHAPRRSAVSA